MAKFAVTYENGHIKKELTFRGEVYSSTMMPWNGIGRTSQDLAFDYQYGGRHPKDKDLDEILELFSEIDFGDDDEIEETLKSLSEYE